MNTIRVADVYMLRGTASEIVSENTSLKEIITTFAMKPGTRGIFLVDTQQRYTGLVSRSELLRWVRLQLFGSKGTRIISIWEFYRLVDAKKAKDLMGRREMKSFSVKESDNLQDALDLMLDYEEEILPVLDRQGKIIGDLRLSEILWKALEVARQLGS